MAQVILVTGGSRSGKSIHAQERAESLPGRRAYVATCPVVDDEMDRRIQRHRKAREGRGWETIEEPTDLAGVLRGHADFDVLLVDCLTLWVNNLMHIAAGSGGDIHEEEIETHSASVLDACRARRGTVIFVTNEVGMGVVPDNEAGRKFRDLVGRCNQAVAAGADEVVLMTCGIPLRLKG